MQNPWNCPSVATLKSEAATCMKRIKAECRAEPSPFAPVLPDASPQNIPFPNCHFFIRRRKTKCHCSLLMTHKRREEPAFDRHTRVPDLVFRLFMSGRLLPPVVWRVSNGAKSPRRINVCWGRSTQSGSRAAAAQGEASARLAGGLTESWQLSPRFYISI